MGIVFLGISETPLNSHFSFPVCRYSWRRTSLLRTSLLIYSVDVLGEEHKFLEKNISRCSWRRTSHTFSGGAEGPRLGPEVDPCPKCSCIVVTGYNIWTPGLGLSSPFAPKSPLQICKYMVQPGDHLP